MDKKRKKKEREASVIILAACQVYYFDVISPEFGWKDGWGLSLSKPHGNPS